MRCLIMATRHMPIATLISVLTEQALDHVSSADLGAGASLGAADLTDITCAVAILPETAGDSRPVAPGLAAILVEVGIAVGRNIPTLVITDPDSPPTPALATLPQVAAHLNDHDTLRLHLGVFVRTVTVERQPTRRPTDPRKPGSGLDLAIQRGRLREIISASGRTSGQAFEQFVLDLLSEAGGQVESNVREEDEIIDAVIGLGGPNGPPLVVLVEVKRLSHSAASLSGAANQLLRYLAIRRADLGLIIVDQPISDAARDLLPPMILAFSADELLDRLTRDPLDRILRRARNRAVHGV